MGTIAELTVPAAEFALRDTLAAVPTVQFEIERVAAHSEGRLIPFVWVRTEEFDRFEEALAEDPTVNGVECLSELDSERLYRMDWVDSIHPVQTVLETDSTVLSATGSDGTWRLRILFPDRESLSAAYDHCQRAGVDFDVTSIYDLEGDRRGQYSLTKEQHDTLVQGVERGYYNVPRDLTLGEFAAGLDISHQALSERLRRGHRNLIESALITGPVEE
ncbi:helix-turn-helix domain-containing protein [Halalkalicoccus jeotgali]|uniref:DNA binding domain-containing protein n=1 Tax=Halalkalicoccus jeotgali (strain DSM 18796 / CECT 7217 / JCM 14584 / KCTC 4019 / B3) TaxID=795797 RepID=D8J4D6_HALJB|nr:bacterio-opsin activator domain-containing protein [Halalkalicoccus jeotgali]ADJ13498.1 DNA binding domain-containing protein [Halalkalicoccus jeotgali B3]ELY33027.1 DNA binding domain-containing protein [Halalkalicoccus jeotgali B3]